MICGALQCEKENFGDALLRKILINNLKKFDPNITIVDYDENMKLKNLLQCDYFIYIPGGYMGYIEKWYSGSCVKSLQRIKSYYWPGIKAVLLRKKIILLGQGIGPYEYPILDKMLKIIATNAELITVRDEKGKALLRKIGVKNKIYLTADTAQTLLQHNFIMEDPTVKRIKENFKSSESIIFVHYIGVPTYENKLYGVLRQTFFDNPNISFVIGADGALPRGKVSNFARLFPKNRFITYKYESVEQLVSIINSVDCVITGKFHVGIVGATLSKAVISLSVQYAKTSLYYEQIGYLDRCVDVFDADESIIKNMIQSYYDKPIELPMEIRQKAQANYEILFDYLGQ